MVAETGYADANSGEDWVLGVSLAFRGRVLMEPTPGRLYRRHATSLWASQRDRPQLVRHARAVRERMRTDRGIPAWAKRLSAPIYLMQLAAIFIVQPLFRASRAAFRPLLERQKNVA
jgi:hypothetical protein